jgi:hypothetical protein
MEDRVTIHSIRATVPFHIHNRLLVTLKVLQVTPVQLMVVRCKDSNKMARDQDSRLLQWRMLLLEAARRSLAASHKASNRFLTWVLAFSFHGAKATGDICYANFISPEY